jgi:hypothetical protein
VTELVVYMFAHPSCGMEIVRVKIMFALIPLSFLCRKKEVPLLIHSIDPSRFGLNCFFLNDRFGLNCSVL